MIYNPRNLSVLQLHGAHFRLLLFVVLWTVLPTSDARFCALGTESAKSGEADLLAGGQSRRSMTRSCSGRLTASGNCPRCSRCRDEHRYETCGRFRDLVRFGGCATGADAQPTSARADWPLFGKRIFGPALLFPVSLPPAGSRSSQTHGNSELRLDHDGHSASSRERAARGSGALRPERQKPAASVLDQDPWTTSLFNTFPNNDRAGWLVGEPFVRYAGTASQSFAVLRPVLPPMRSPSICAFSIRRLRS